MVKRVSFWGLVIVAIVVAVQLLLSDRSQPPEELPQRPREQLPAVDSSAEPPPPNAELAVPPEAVARNDVAPGAVPADAPRKFERRIMFTCSDNQFFVRIGDGEVRLLPPGSLTEYYIPLARAGASTWRGRYANEDIEFRDGGDVGAVTLGAHSFDNCVATRDRASLGEANTGVTFQAFGHSPQWSFEIVVPEGFVLTTQRGEQHVVPFREPIDSGRKITFRSVLGTQEMVVVVDRIPCLDAPSGETLAHAVTVTFDNEWYYGCGRFIRYRDEPAASR
jgi:uncharacterized membrane protein